MRLIYDPSQHEVMNVAFFVSGKGTIYQKIRETDTTKRYVVFSNAPTCKGAERAKNNGDPLVILDSKKYKELLGVNKIPRKGVERDSYDMAAATLVEQEIGNPDLICLAGYELWLGNWFVDRYHPTILNTHPADMTKKYKGLHWIPIAKAILAAEYNVKATVFIVDKSDDEGPILIQSASLSLARWDNEISDIRRFEDRVKATNLAEFIEAAEREYQEIYEKLKAVSTSIQDELKEVGDRKIFPFAVHELVGKGRAAIDDNGAVYVDGVEMPREGYQVDEHGFTERIQRWV